MVPSNRLIMVKKGKSSRGVVARSIRRGHPERIQTMPPTQPSVAAVDVGDNFDVNLMSQKTPIDLSDMIGDKAFANNIDFPDCLTIDIKFNPSSTTNEINSTKVPTILSQPDASTKTKGNITTHGINGHILTHSKMLCNYPYWRQAKYCLPSPIQLGPRAPTSSLSSIELRFNHIKTLNSYNNPWIHDIEVISDKTSLLPINEATFMSWWCEGRDIMINNLTYNRPHNTTMASAYTNTYLPILSHLVLNDLSTWSITDMWQV